MCAHVCCQSRLPHRHDRPADCCDACDQTLRTRLDADRLIHDIETLLKLTGGRP